MDNKPIKEESFFSKRNIKVIFRLFPFLLNKKLIVILVILFLASASFLESYNTYIIRNIIDKGIVQKDTTLLVSDIIQYGICVILLALMLFGMNFYTGILGAEIQSDIRRKLFSQIQHLPLGFHNRTPSGWLIARMISDTHKTSDGVTCLLLDIAWVFTSIISSVVFMIIINLKLALILLAMFPFIILFVLVFKQYILRETRLQRQINSEYVALCKESVTGQKTIKNLTAQPENEKRFFSLSSRMFDASYKAAWLSAMMVPAIQVMGTIMLGIIIWYGGSGIVLREFTIGDLKAFITYILFIIQPLNRLAKVYSEYQSCIASTERIFSLLDTAPEEELSGDIPQKAISKGKIAFHNISFYYREGNPVIKDFSLEVCKGEAVAFAGPTGCGKTTLINLLCRFFEPQQGEILFDGIDCRYFPLTLFRERIGIVFQSPFLFSGTVLDNIRYGKLDADDNEVIRASKAASAHEFITHLDKSYNTKIGEAGVSLSYGQKQLINIARVILRDPDIVILDEPASSLDEATGELLQTGIRNALQNKTSFIIAHHLSLVRFADRIIFIENGRKKEAGNHEALMAEKGLYYRYYMKMLA